MPAALAIALAALPARAQQNPGLATRPSGFSLDDTNAPAEPPIDLTRPNPQAALNATSDEALYLDAAMRGEAWAQTKLGKIYIETPNDPESLQKGLQLLQQAAAQKDAEAIYLLAGVTAAGVVDKPSNIAAMEKIKEAAMLGSADAQYELASMYAEGRGVHRDMNQALFWGRKAAKQGNPQAQLSVGRTLIVSNDPGDKSEGIGYLEKATEAGDINATLFWATTVGKGDHGVPKDENRAEALLKPLAERGNADCQFVLAALYRYGDAFADRRSEAYVWLQHAAEQGHADALKVLESEGR